MNWIKQIWQRIIESDNQPLLNEIESLKKEKNVLLEVKRELQKELNLLTDEYQSETDAYQAQVDNLEDELDNLEEQIKEMTKTINDVTLDTYFKKIYDRKKQWKPGKIIRMRESLQNFSQDQEYQSKYKAFLDEIKAPVGVKTPDAIVYLTTGAVLDWVDGKYKTDLKSFGVNEYWLSPQEAFDFYVTQEKYADCEDVAALLWGAIVTRLLEYGYADELWRLKRINIFIEGSGGHAICSWLKDNLVHAPIETTFAQQTWRDDWKRDCDVFKAMYGNVYNIFDEDSEYKLK